MMADEIDDSSPTVVAYRVGRLEKTVEKGFAAQTQQIKDFSDKYITRVEFQEKVMGSQNEHKDLWRSIDDIRRGAKWWAFFIVTAMMASATVLLVFKK